MDRLWEGLEVTEMRGDPAAVEVTSVELDSRQVTPGALFVCVPGRRADGHDYAGAAAAHGAAALVVERVLPVDLPQVVVRSGTARRALAQLAGAFYGHPARALTMVGVTGTNGKTTVTHLVASILDAAGRPSAVVGTLQGERTTPEAPVVQRILDEARRGGRSAVAMEVSSHALTEARVDGIRFDAAVFTNLGHDHLDHHGTMEAYFEAKASLFTPVRAALGVVNADDPWGRRLLERCTIPLVRYGLDDADGIESGPAGTAFRWRGRRIELALSGAYQVGNALAAATTASALGVADDVVAEGLAGARRVPGRFEVVDVDAPFTVVVDYAHTPDALAAALDSARRLVNRGRVLCVFGCGGDRDKEKRPLMAQVATAAADLTVITSDNPRHEDPTAIVEEVARGAAAGAEVEVEVDRGAAIALAVGRARAGDVVLVAGKGHESVIEVGDDRIPFDDRAVAAAAVAALGGGG